MSGWSSQPRTSNATRSTGTVPCVVRKARTLAEENLKERRRRPTGTCGSWYGTEGWMRVQHQLEHQLPPSEAPADPSICPSLSSRRRHHQVVGLLELCDGHGAGFAFEFVYREQLSQPQVARSCMPMRCCSFSLWNLSKTLGKDQPVRGAQRDERQSL